MGEAYRSEPVPELVKLAAEVYGDDYGDPPEVIYETWSGCHSVTVHTERDGDQLELRAVSRGEAVNAVRGALLALRDLRKQHTADGRESGE